MELFLSSAAKAIAEVAAFALLGQGILWVFAGANRERNIVYRMFRAVTQPVFRLARLITPKFVEARHLWLVATLVVFWAWVGAVIWKITVIRGMQ
jgi:hypothetical protein